MHNVDSNYNTLSLFVKAPQALGGHIFALCGKCLTSPWSLCYNTASVKTPRIE